MAKAKYTKLKSALAAAKAAMKVPKIKVRKSTVARDVVSAMIPKAKSGRVSIKSLQLNRTKANKRILKLVTAKRITDVSKL